MQLTTRGRYGVMAMVDLAARAAMDPAATRPAPVGLPDLAERHRLSLCYLEQLFRGLRRAGLVASVRGPGGGYRLALAAEDVSIADILAAVGETVQAPEPACEAPVPPSACGDRAVQGRTHALWEALGQHLRTFLSTVTLADVLAGDLCGFATVRVPVVRPAPVREPVA